MRAEQTVSAPRLAHCDATSGSVCPSSSLKGWGARSEGRKVLSQGPTFGTCQKSSPPCGVVLRSSDCRFWATILAGPGIRRLRCTFTVS